MEIKIQKKQVITAVVILAVIATAYWFLFIKPKKDAEKELGTTGSTGSKTTSYNNDTPLPMGLGSKGLKVKQLQRYLNAVINAGLTVDGDWGAKTQTAFTKAPATLLYTKVTQELYDKLQLAKY
jgi:hypothetical protein